MVPFQYGWLDEMFWEMATYVFFAVTAYKFRPADGNPYFQVNRPSVVGAANRPHVCSVPMYT